MCVGNAEKLRPETWQRLAMPSGLPGCWSATSWRRRPRRRISVAGLERRTRAILQVQQGCDHRCTFCIIPFGRGPSRSVALPEIVAQARALVASGYVEFVVTGVDLTSYGRDLPGQPTLGAMLASLLAEVPELRRLRLSSLDPAAIDAELCRLVAEEPRLMPHLHLSVQAGHDLILKRMKRRHGRSDVVEVTRRLRRLRPDLMFGADLIAGFPTEDEAMFQGTLDLVEEAGLTFLHVFPFSPRPGTPAARMPQVAARHAQGARGPAARPRRGGAGPVSGRAARPAPPSADRARRGRPDRPVRADPLPCGDHAAAGRHHRRAGRGGVEGGMLVGRAA